LETRILSNIRILEYPEKENTIPKRNILFDGGVLMQAVQEELLSVPGAGPVSEQEE
jgi:hypothetical protein